MNIVVQIIRILLLSLLLLLSGTQQACSIFKVTLHGRTMFCNNEDSWNTDPYIWFENGRNGKLGAVFFGYKDGVPQGAMNEQGLAYDGVSIPPRTIKPIEGKKEIPDKKDFLKTILKSYRTVSEVKAYLEQFDYGIYPDGAMFFMDRNGDYLIVEADTIMSGHDPKYILTNFCPSTTPDLSAVKLPRYIKGVRYMNTHVDTSVSYCTSMLDTMHVCRKHLGDGTLYSYIHDLDAGTTTVYFYHDFSHPVSFSLKDELKKGDHLIEMASLFPANKEFTSLLHYHTPLNTRGLFLSLKLFIPFFFLSGLFFFLSFVVQSFMQKKNKYTFFRLLAALVFTGTGICCLALTEDNSIAYLGFNDLTMINKLSSYMPMLLLIAIVPLVWGNIVIVRTAAWRKFALFLLSLDTAACLLCLLAFMYWGLF